METDEIKSMINSLDLAIKYNHDEPKRQIEVISKYYELLSRLLTNIYDIPKMPYELVIKFESVYLFTLDKLLYFKETIREQYKNIVEQSSLCEYFTTISIFTLDKSLMNRYRMKKSISEILSVIPVKIVAKDSNDYITLTNKELFKIKASLLRLFQILQYASNTEAIIYDEGIYDIKEHYNPDIINKNKVITLVSLLKYEISQIEDVKTRDILESKIDAIETELRKPGKIKWGFIITTFFILFGFTADLKSISPETYEKTYRIIENIVKLIHDEGQVSKDNNDNKLLIGQDIEGILPRKEQ